MLYGHRRFSQFLSYFPNIYLVNAQNCEHPHSYWLKRLIVAFLQKKNETGEHLSPELVISIFRGVEGKGYSDILIIEVKDPFWKTLGGWNSPAATR
jgi:hypothetical protein